MKYLYLYKYLRVQAASASTNWTNWKNPDESLQLFQFVQLVLLIKVCTCTHRAVCTRLHIVGWLAGRNHFTHIELWGYFADKHVTTPITWVLPGPSMYGGETSASSR